MEAARQNGFRGSSRFRVVSRLGSGANGEVYEAIDAESDSRVALKTLREASPDMLFLLKREFRAVQDLRHPNLVSLGELLEEEGQWFFTMELVDGVDFLQYVSRWRPSQAPQTTHVRRSNPGSVAPAPPRDDGPSVSLDEGRLRRALGQLVAALRALHAAGKVHRDVKPSNILVSREGRLVLLDFGIVADARGRTFEDDDELVGTPVYMAPEQVTSGEIGPAADWYAVGVLLYQALTGRLPFSGSITAVLSAKVVQAPEPPREVAPGVPSDLDALCVDLLAIDPVKRPDGKAIARRLGLEDDPVPADVGGDLFVGRRKELASLEEAFGTVRRGKSVVLFVQGESGVGKTALTAHFGERLQETVPDLVLLRGRCYERESVPYKAIDDVVDTLAHFLKRCPPEIVPSLLPDDLAILCRSFPVLKTAIDDTRPGAPDADVVSPREQRARLFGAMRDLLAKLAARWPLVVTIDDLHWADTDSIGLLTEMLRTPGEPRMLLACTIRNETAIRARARDIADELTRAAADVRVLHVEKLPSDDAIELARALAEARTGNAELGAGVVQQILAEAQGHPLFIDELVRRRAGARSDGEVIHLDDVLWQRVRALEPAARRFLELVAVAGVPVLQEIVAAAAGLDRAVMPTAVHALQHAHLIRTSGERSSTLVHTYHDRVRESVVAHLSADAVTTAHGQLAVAAEQGGRADADFLFIHWEGARNAARAAEYARAAGDRAAEALAFERAAHLYRRALDLDASPSVTRRETQTRLAEALTSAGHEAEAAEVRLELARDADPIAALDLRRQAAEQMLVSGHFDRGKALLREVLQAVHERFPLAPMAVIFWLVVVRLALRVRGVAVREREAGALDKRALLRIDALWSAGAGFAMTDNIRGAYFQTKNLLLASKVGDVRRAARALAMEVCFRSVSASKGATRNLALLEEARRLAERVGTPDALALADTAAGYVHYFLGNWRTSIDAFVRAESAFRDRCVGVHWQISSTRTMLYRALGFAGRIEELRSRYPAVLRDAEQRRDLFTVINVLCSTTYLVALAEDRVDAAEAVLADAGRSLPSGAFLVQHYYHLLALVQVDLYAGRARDARERMRAAMPAIRRSLLMRVGSFRAQTADVQARIALAIAESEGGAASALVDASKATRALASVAVPWAPVVAKLHGAALLSLQGRRDDASSALRAAVDALGGAGLDALAAAARRRLGVLVGGDEGAALVRDAEAFEAAQGVARGASFAAMVAPGFGRGAPSSVAK